MNGVAIFFSYLLPIPMVPIVHGIHGNLGYGFLGLVGVYTAMLGGAYLEPWPGLGRNAPAQVLIGKTPRAPGAARAEAERLALPRLRCPVGSLRVETRLMAPLTLQRAALALALFAIGGQLIELAHFGLVPHAVCAEHGELIHVEGKPRALARRANESAPAGYESPGEAGDSSDAHEHCLVSAVRRERTAVAAASAIAVHAQGTLDVLPPAHETASIGRISILHLAPKSSPPRVRA